MAIDLKMDMGSLLKGFSNKDGKAMAISLASNFKNSIILFVLSLAIFISYFNFYYKPMTADNIKKKAEITRLTDLKNKSAELATKIATLKKTLNDTKEHYLESLSHFGNSEDLGELYQSVSTLAAKYDLVVLNIKEVPVKAAPAPAAPAPVKKDAKAAPAAKDAKAPAPAANAKQAAKPAAPAKPLMDVKEVQVAVELKGKYGSYIKFKEDLAIAEMLLKVNSENIKVKNDKDEPGNIYVALNLSTYAIDKKPFQKAMDSNDEGKENAK